MSSIWYEKYKPQKVQDVVLPQKLKDKIQGYVNKKDIPNMLLKSDTGGTGKTALSHQVITDMKSEALWINASLERGIDVLRGKIQKFASSSSFDDNLKIVILDEIDGTSIDLQKALRGFLDSFSSNCRFIMTCNYSEQIIPQLLNRLEIYDFDALDKKEMLKPTFEKLKTILEAENIEYNPKDVQELIKQNYPSIRGMISDLQKFSSSGMLEFNQEDLGGSSTFDDVMKAQDYMDMLERVNALNTPGSMFTHLYNDLSHFKDASLPQVIVTLAKYQEMNSHVRDKHLNLGACLTELWKHKK